MSAFTRVYDALWRSDAMQTRDRYGHRIWNGPGSAVHRSLTLTLHRVRDKKD